MERARTIKLVMLLCGVVVLGCSLVCAQWLLTRPREFRGVLQYPMAHIGGEGSAAILVAPKRGYDLFFDGRRPTDQQLTALAGKPVLVVGRPFTARGLERGRYPAIRVLSIVAAPAPPSGARPGGSG